jgi:hypothetical protein
LPSKWFKASKNRQIFLRQNGAPGPNGAPFWHKTAAGSKLDLHDAALRSSWIDLIHHQLFAMTHSDNADLGGLTRLANGKWQNGGPSNLIDQLTAGRSRFG